MDSNHKTITGNAKKIPRKRVNLQENAQEDTKQQVIEKNISEDNKPLHKSARLRSVIQNRKQQQLAAQLQRHTHLSSYNDIKATRH
ncbi:MAG: hypothetical protein V4525_04300 [Pseudomonadota bacterium]